MSQSLVKPFKNSLYESMADVSSSVLEMDGLNEIMGEEISEIAKSIPFINTLRSLCKSAYSIKTIIEMKNFTVFFNEIRKQNINQKEVERHIEKINNKKQYEREVSFVIANIAALDDELKAKLIANIYGAYLKNCARIPYFAMADLIKVVQDMYITDIYTFAAAYNNEYLQKENETTMYIGQLSVYELEVSIHRLLSLKLLDFDSENIIGMEKENENVYNKSEFMRIIPNLKKTQFGNMLYQFIKPTLQEIHNSEKRREMGLK
ncbi:TPA: hypothetical protein PTV44_002383 [Clostridium botulinum]|nr:hypothetical protein [Clostridium botulinum]